MGFTYNPHTRRICKFLSRESVAATSYVHSLQWSLLNNQKSSQLVCSTLWTADMWEHIEGCWRSAFCIVSVHHKRRIDILSFPVVGSFMHDDSNDYTLFNSVVWHQNFLKNSLFYLTITDKNPYITYRFHVRDVFLSTKKFLSFQVKFSFWKLIFISPFWSNYELFKD